jgi:hypothetical protein
MRKTAWVAGAFLACVLTAYVALGEQGTVREDETGATFPSQKNVGGTDYVLVGVGAREALGSINVYGAGMYLGREAGIKAWQSYVADRFAKAGLVANGQPDLTKITKVPEGRHFMAYGSMPRYIEMHFVRDVRADQITEVYEEAWVRTKLDRNAAGDALTKFMEAVNHPMANGKVMSVRTVGNTIFVDVGGIATKVDANRAIITAIWRNYFGEPCLQRPLRDGLMSKLSNLAALVPAN